jgi:2-oxoglutarate ferredoxin oxidoreductase subunit alpha
MMGDDAIVSGAVNAGCRFIAVSPTPVLEPFLRQAETASRSSYMSVTRAADGSDAVGRCIGAAARGQRAMALTSGVGLAACRENIAFAHLAELPIVILHVQHLDAGLAGPVLLGDADVVLARYLGFGGLPLPVLAATDDSSASKLIGDAFQIADDLRTPVILLLSAQTPEAETPLRPETAAPPRPPDDAPVLSIAGLRFDAATRPGFVQFAGQVDGKRVFLPVEAAKLEDCLKRLGDKIMNAGEMLEKVIADPDPEAETLLISYGHADQAARQAVRTVRENRARVSHLTLHSLWPVPQKALRRALTPFVRRVLVPELNIGLYAEELSKVLRTVKIESIARYDGRPIDAQTIIRRLTEWPCG